MFRDFILVHGRSMVIDFFLILFFIPFLLINIEMNYRFLGERRG